MYYILYQALNFSHLLIYRSPQEHHRLAATSRPKTAKDQNTFDLTGNLNIQVHSWDSLPAKLSLKVPFEVRVLGLFYKTLTILSARLAQLLARPAYNYTLGNELVRFTGPPNNRYFFIDISHSLPTTGRGSWLLAFLV